jgi:hypothetical protein
MPRLQVKWWLSGLLAIGLAWQISTRSGMALAQPDSAETTADSPAADEPAETAPKKRLAKDPPGMTRLQPDANAWVDPKHKRVVVDGEVCLIEGQLEMFACLKGTKEHESVIAVDVPAAVIHAALLAIGAETGNPVQFHPEYREASGTPIDIELVWTDASGVHRANAKDWVKNTKTGKPLEIDWVFAGSSFYEDEDTGEKYYQAEGGDFICVSNFPSAMLDLPVESSQANAALLFEANSDAIPPRGTRVRLVLTPKPAKP